MNVAVYISQSFTTDEKGMNLTILPPAMDKL